MNHKVSIKLVIGTIIAFVFMLGAIGATVTRPIHPSYCARCHGMEHQYRTWTDTVKCPVRSGCLECHTGAGTGIYLATEIDDRNCMKSGCHTREKLFAKEESDNNPGHFSHESHLKEWAYGQNVGCTACHARQERDKHFGIDKNTCYVCHFVRGEGEVKMVSQLEKPLWECSVCHKEVEKKIQIYDKEFDHASFEKPGVDCNSCHNNGTVRGTGMVDKDSCYRCHVPGDIPEDYTSADDMHHDHLARQGVSCSPCHEEIRHNVYRDISEMDSPAAPGNAPAETLIYRKMMVGDGGKGVPGTPDPMNLATVSCSGCHGDDLKTPV
ncbi:MAG: cytochrome c3 family protein, partial [Candidatus Brocadiales bacterium]